MDDNNNNNSFKPGDLIITKLHICNNKLSPDSGRWYSACIDADEVGLVLKVLTSFMYAITHYQVLFGEGKIMEVWPSEIEKYPRVKEGQGNDDDGLPDQV